MNMKTVTLEMMIATVLCLCSIGAFAGLNEALDAKRRGDGKTAIAEFSKLANKGDVRAMLTIGGMYLNAEGIREDYAKARVWYLKALAKGDADAMNNIGVMYRDSLGVKQDLELAYALFLRASTMCRNDDTYGRVTRNTDKLLQYMTKDQVARAKKIRPSALTEESITKHVSSAESSRREIDLLPKGWKNRLKTTFQERQINSATNSRPATLCIRNDEYSDMPGTLGFSSGLEESPETFLKAGIYGNGESRMRLEVPRFSTGNITLHQSKLPGSGVYMLRISDGNVAIIEPWIIPADSWHGIAITTLLPASWATRGDDAFAKVVEMQKSSIREISPKQTAVTILSSPRGKICEAIVLNQTTTPIYPQSDARVLPASDGLKSIGISRMMYRDNVIVHLALIVKRQKAQNELDLLEFACRQMDDFQARFRLLPKTK
jgi:hypothetical protein